MTKPSARPKFELWKIRRNPIEGQKKLLLLVEFLFLIDNFLVLP